MATRPVEGTIHTPLGEPWAGFEVRFTLTPSAFTPTATLPERTVTATTDAGTLALGIATDPTLGPYNVAILIPEATVAAAGDWGAGTYTIDITTATGWLKPWLVGPCARVSAGTEG